jgi:DNA-directed RNA polymerase subunit RPC12/RpoP
LEKLYYILLRGLMDMHNEKFVEYLCLSCGLQGLRGAEKTNEPQGDICPKCGEKLLTLVRRDPGKTLSASV